MAWYGTKTWSVGDPVTADDMNDYVAFDSLFLYGDPAAGHVSAAPSNPSGGAYSPYTEVYSGSQFADPTTLQVGDIVHLSGVMVATRAGTAIRETLAVVSPAYWPAHEQILDCDMNNAACRVDVTPTGLLALFAVAPLNAVISLNGSYSVSA